MVRLANQNDSPEQESSNPLHVGIIAGEDTPTLHPKEAEDNGGESPQYSLWVVGTCVIHGLIWDGVEGEKEGMGRRQRGRDGEEEDKGGDGEEGEKGRDGRRERREGLGKRHCIRERKERQSLMYSSPG